MFYLQIPANPQMTGQKKCHLNAEKKLSVENYQKMNQVLKLADKGCNTEIHIQELKKNMVIMN